MDSRNLIWLLPGLALAANLGSWELPHFKLRKNQFRAMNWGDALLVALILLLLSTGASNNCRTYRGQYTLENMQERGLLD